MNLIIKELVPDLASELINYFCSLNFSHSPEWSSCFCRYYYNGCTNEEWFKRTAEENESEAEEEILKGNMKGFLAYVDDKCVGWLSANDIDKLIRIKELKVYTGSEKVACTNCFVIDPDYRNMGLARKLLENAINHYRKAGYECMIALPVDNSSVPEKRYRGTKKMYHENGYITVNNDGDFEIMVLNL